MNSETAKLREGTLAKLLQRFGLIVFLYDSDDTGKRESALRAQECLNYGCTAKHLLSVPEMLKNFPVIYSVTLPLAGTKQEKDVSDFFKLGHTASELREIVIDSIINTKDEFVKTKY